MRLAKTTLIHFISTVAKTVVGFLVMIYLARTVGASVLGVYFVVVALLSWASIPGAAVANAVNKRISEGRDKGAYVSSGLLLGLGLFVPIAGLLILFRNQVEAYVGEPVLTPFLILLAGQLLLYQMNSGLMGQKKVAHSGVLLTTDRVLRGILQISLVYLGYSLFGLLAGHIFAIILVAIAGYSVYDVRPSLPNKEHFKSIIDYARYSWLGGIKTRTFAWTDTIILNFFVVSALIGVYEIAWNIASMFVLINISLTQSIFPEVSDISSNGDGEEQIPQLLKEMVIFSGIFVIPGFFGALVLGPEILGIYGDEFVQGSTVLLLLILARGVHAYSEAFLTIINGVNRPDVAFRINGVFVTTNIVLNIVLISMFGWYGAAIATLAASTAALFLSFWAVSGIVGRPEIPVWELLKQISSAVMMASVVYIVTIWLGAVTLIHILGAVSVGVILYFGSLMYMSEVVRERLISVTPY